MISEAHQQTLQLKYGLPADLIQSLDEIRAIESLSPDEVRRYLDRNEIDSTGILLRYADNGASTIRLDTPAKSELGRPIRYLRRSDEPNCLFVPPGVDLLAEELWVVEGELKALCGHARGLQIVGLSGVWNWRSPDTLLTELMPDKKLPDKEALLPELAQIDWKGKKVCLLYDSDISPGHVAYDAFPRLAEQLYRLGCEEVRIVSLPPVLEEGKTGLDDFFLAQNRTLSPYSRWSRSLR
jgi:hypothetical protein